MRDGHQLLQDQLKALHEQKTIGRPAGAKNRPMPLKEGPLWEEFLHWFSCAAVPADRRADLWRAFSAGAGVNTKRDVAT